MKILIINGPNLNLLGKRETKVYGSQSFEDYLMTLQKEFENIDLDYFQSNHEGELIDKLHNADEKFNGIVLNAGGFTHTSVALADAIASISTPVIEVHISNIYAREEFRRKSLLSANCAGIIAGFGLTGYSLAIQYLHKEKHFNG